MKARNKKTLRKLSRKVNTRTFLEHLQELRSRLFTWFACFIIGSMIGYFLYPFLLSWLISPLNKPLYYTSPTGGFEAVFSTSIFFGFIVSIPVLLYQIIKFLEPTFVAVTVKIYLAIIISSLALASIGILLSYYTILPTTFEFLNRFGGDQLSALISTNDYFSFVIKYLLAFAAIFQLPLGMLLINKFKKLEVKKLLSSFKYIFLLSFIISAILTPTPDLINQTIMATPIIVLYLVSIFMVWIIQLKTNSVAKRRK